MRRYPGLRRDFDLPVGVSFRRQDYFDNTHAELRRSRRHLGGAALERPCQGCRPVAAHRHRLGEASSRNYSLIEHPRAEAEPGPCSSGRRGARPALRARSADPGGREGIRRGGARARAGGTRPGANRPRWRTRSTSPRSSRRQSGDVQLGDIVRWLAPSAGRCNRRQRRRQLLRLGQRLLPVPPLPLAARPDQRLHGLRHAGGDRRQAGPP